MANFQTALEAMTVKESDDSDVLWHGPVRFERSAGKTNQNAIELPKFLHELCSALSRFDQHFQFRDKNGQILSLDALPSTQALCESAFNYQVVEKRSVNQMLFVADMISSKPFGQLKNAAWSILKKYGMWMFRHELSISRLDVNTAGWLLGINPRYHSPDLQRQLMKQAMEKWWSSLTPDYKSSWERKLKNHKRGDSIFPDFYCNPRNVRGTFSEISSLTTAFNIITADEDTKIVGEILAATFPPDAEPENGIGMFIPMGLRRSNAAHFLRLVQHQQEYLDNYQIVSVAGITKAIMHSEMTLTAASGETRNMTVQAAFQLNPSIHRVDPGSYLLRLGKWNISTTKSEADDAKTWIDSVIAAMPHESRHNSEYSSFPTAARMKALAQPTTSSGYASLAGTYSMDSLKAHQDARDKATHRPSTATLSQNPQDPSTPSMAIFAPSPNGQTHTTDHPSYASAASYSRSNTNRYNGQDGSTPSHHSTTIPSPMAKEIAELKTTVASLQHTKTTTPNNNDISSPPVTPNIMQMFQQLSENMQDSSSRMTKFHTSMEAKVDTMESSIKDIQQVHINSQTMAKTFQDDVQQELRSLRAENTELHSRIDSLSQKSSVSPRRKKSKERHKPAVLEPKSPDSEHNTTVTFYQPPTTNVSFPSSEEASEVASDEEDTVLMDPTGLADNDDDDPLNNTTAMQTDPASPDEET
jgi:hypothetical protein